MLKRMTAKSARPFFCVPRAFVMGALALLRVAIFLVFDWPVEVVDVSQRLAVIFIGAERGGLLVHHLVGNGRPRVVPQLLAVAEREETRLLTAAELHVASAVKTWVPAATMRVPNR